MYSPSLSALAILLVMLIYGFLPNLISLATAIMVFKRTKSPLAVGIIAFSVASLAYAIYVLYLTRFLNDYGMQGGSLRHNLQILMQIIAPVTPLLWFIFLYRHLKPNETR